jgi:hypothetical protein
MQTIEYLDLVDKEIKNYFLDKSYNEADLEIIQVWYCKTIQNHKGLFIVRNKDTNIIYPQFIEATYNGDAKELYLDLYEKQFKSIIKVGD